MKTLAAAFFLAFASAVAADALDYRIDLERSIGWDRMELDVTAALDLASAGLKLPVGRSRAEEIAAMEFPRLVQPTILSLPVDSSTDMEDLVNSGSTSLESIASIAAAAHRAPPALSSDLGTLFASYKIDLRAVAADLVRHRRPSEPPRPLEIRSSRAYTGIVVYIDEPLPVHGKKGAAEAQACFFPKIWDSDMTLIYERNMVEPGTAAERGIVRYASAQDVLLEGSEASTLAGPSPLRILARELFGVRPVDPVIDPDDALKIISSEENRRLLREGRVVFVIGNEALKALK